MVAENDCHVSSRRWRRSRPRFLDNGPETVAHVHTLETRYGYFQLHSDDGVGRCIITSSFTIDADIVTEQRSIYILLQVRTVRPRLPFLLTQPLSQ